MKKLKAAALVAGRKPGLTSEQAASYIVCRNVFIDGVLCTDPKAEFREDVSVEFVFPKYVSRGGLKLERALELFDFPVSGKVFIDAGSSTGGFTDCLLQNGAKAVHCVDVGYNQLDYRLRADSRVIVHEKTNIMDFVEADPGADAAVADLSFRSVAGAAEHILNLTAEKRLVALIKPQFEYEGKDEGFDGVVKDRDLFVRILSFVREKLCSRDVGIIDACVSPVRGHKGNTEVLAYLVPGAGRSLSLKAFLEKVL